MATMTETPARPKSSGDNAPTLSALVVIRNEEEQLAACLEALRFADQIVVVLDRSTDGSRGIAESFSATVLDGAWEVEGDRRNAGIAACAGAWILEIDADERVPRDLGEEICAAIRTAAPGYFAIRYTNHVGGRPVVHGWGAYNGVNQKNCLFSEGAKSWGRQRVHPAIEMSGTAGRLDGRIDHYVDRSIADMFDRLNRYSTLAAAQARADGRAPGLFSSLRRIFSRFFKSYVSRKGYREGATGLALALFSALYPILTYIKCATDAREDGKSS